MTKSILTLFTFLLLLLACANNESNFQTTVAEVKEIVKSPHNYKIIDVRTPTETAEGHIDGAVTIDVKADDFESKIDALDRSQNYIIYCRSGKRSTKAYKIMKQKGFTNVLNMEGGYLGYIEDE